MGLEPAPIDKLNKRQNRGLTRALAFRRADRTQSVDEFLDALRRKKSRIGLYAGAAVLVLLLAAAAYTPIVDQLRSQKIETIIVNMSAGGLGNLQGGLDEISGFPDLVQRDRALNDPRTSSAVAAHIQRGDVLSIQQGLALIVPFPQRWQRSVLRGPGARKAITNHYSQRLREVFAPTDGRLDFPGAIDIVEQLQVLYPKSASVLSIRNGIETQKNTLLEQLQGDFEQRLSNGALMARADVPDITVLLVQIAQLDPAHPLIADTRLRAAFVSYTEKALQASELDRAAALVDAGLAYIPDHPQLTKLNNVVADRQREAEHLQRLAKSRRAVADASTSDLDIGGYKRLRDHLLTVLEFAPDDPVLAVHLARVAVLFPRHFSQAVDAGNWQSAEIDLIALAPLLDLATLRSARSRLNAVGAETAPGSPGRTALITQRIDDLLAKSTPGLTWTEQVLVLFKELVALPAEHSSTIDTVSARIAAGFVDQARQAIAATDFPAARVLLESGHRFAPGWPDIETVRSELKSASEAHARHLAEQGRQKHILSLQEAFMSFAEQNEAALATDVLNELRALVPTDDTFLVTEGPAQLGASYFRLAKRHADNEDYESALPLVDLGLVIAPKDEALHGVRRIYAAELQRLALIIELRNLFAADRLLPAGIERKLERLKESFPGRYPSLRIRFAAVRLEQTLAAAAQATPDGDNLAARVAEFGRIFPDHRDTLFTQLEAALVNRIAPIAGTDALEAHGWLDWAISLLPNTIRLERIRTKLPPRHLILAESSVSKGKLNEALELVGEGLAANPDHAGFAELKAKIDSRMTEANVRFAEFSAAVKAGKIEPRERRAEALASILRSWSDNSEFTRINYVDRRVGQCAADLGGEGNLETGLCYDLIAAKLKGPVLVVVPASTTDDLPAFAITKYEVSLTEYDIYCRSSGSCAGLAGKNPNHPATGLSIGDAQMYAAWLSARASASEKTTVVYRLPSQKEWLHAARADGEQALKGINCKPDGKVKLSASFMQSQGGTLSLGVPIGRSLVSATFGEANAWGIVNAIGNAQEWVRAATGLLVHGGAYPDRASECSINLHRTHNGAADPITGFRPVRDLG